jgi:hypothetical protein
MSASIAVGAVADHLARRIRLSCEIARPAPITPSPHLVCYNITSDVPSNRITSDVPSNRDISGTSQG